MKKTLIVSGCSFTFEPWNWPTYVAEHFDMNLVNVGLASQGNGLISKKAIYTVDVALKSKKAEDLLVGIMWSGISRYDFYVKDTILPKNTNGWQENPTSVIGTDDTRNWMILNWGWENEYSKQWYGNFDTDIGSVIRTLQNILFTQWYLERNNVNYFMTTYMDIFENFNFDSSPELGYLYNMIDFTKFLPVDGCFEWVRDNYLKKGLPELDKYGNQGDHPKKFGHQKFAAEVINKHLDSNVYI